MDTKEQPVAETGQNQAPEAQTPQSPQVPQGTSGGGSMSLARKINRTMAFVLIFSGIGFVLITILAIWEVFGPDAGSIVWRALGSLGAIALGALIISVASKLIDEHHK